MDHVSQEKISAILISLDAEKAFDSVGWDYLFQVMYRFGFNKEVIHCVKTLFMSDCQNKD